MVKPVQTAFSGVPKRLHEAASTLSLAIYNQVMDGEFACANELSLLLALFAGLSFYALRKFGTL